jgi:hypothetical protein
MQYVFPAACWSSVMMETQTVPTASDMSSKSLAKTFSTQPIQPNVNAKMDLISTLSHTMMIIPRPGKTVVDVEHNLIQKKYTS